MVKRDPAALIERLPTRRPGFDYGVAAAVVAALALALALVGHADPVSDAAGRRVVYLAAAAAGPAMAFAVATWTNATYSDKSPRVVKFRARQGKALISLRYRVQVASLLLLPAGLLAALLDKDGTWRELLFYPWLALVLAVALGVWRALRLSYRVHDLVRADDEDSDRPPPPSAFTWSSSAAPTGKR